MTHKNLYIVGTLHYDIDGKERLDYILERIEPRIVALETSDDRYNAKTQSKNDKEVKETIDKSLEKNGLILNNKQKQTLYELGQITGSIKGFELRSSEDYIHKNNDSRLEHIDVTPFINVKEEYGGRLTRIENSIEQIAKDPELKKEFLETSNEGIDAFKKLMREEIQKEYELIKRISEKNYMDIEKLSSDAKYVLANMFKDPEVHKIFKWKDKLGPSLLQAVTEIFDPERDEAISSKIRDIYHSNAKDVMVAIVNMPHLHGLKLKIEDLEPMAITLAEYNRV